MLDMHDLVGARAIDVAQSLPAVVAHDDQLAGARDEPVHNPALVRIRFGENGMQRDDQRRGDAIDKLENHLPAAPPKMPNSC